MRLTNSQHRLSTSLPISYHASVMWSIFTFVLLIAALLSFSAAALAWRRRAASGGLSMALMFLAVGIWCCFSGLETTSTTTAQRYMWSALSYIGVCNVAPLLLVFAIRYSGSRWPLNAWTIGLVWSVPLVTLVMAFTNGFHHLIWTAITPGSMTGTNTAIYHHGSWFTIEMAWFLGLSLLASYHLIRVAIRAARLYVIQSIVLLASIAISWLGLLLFVLPNGPTPGLDTTSIGFAVSAILIMASHYRLGFLDVVPQARALLVEQIPDGILVLDIENRIIDMNPAARRAFRLDSSDLGGTLDETLPDLNRVLAAHDAELAPSVSQWVEGNATFELSIARVTNRAGGGTGRLVLVRDITERRRVEVEREKLISDLSEALGNIKRLSGLLPICSSCKKIRDDQGYWHQVESYMKDHAEVQFSHGLCPDCMKKLYPEFAEEMRKGNDR